MPLNSEQINFIETVRNAYLQEVGSDPSKLMQLISVLRDLSQMLPQTETVAQDLNEGEIYCVFNPPNPTIADLPVAEIKTSGSYTIPGGLYRKVSIAVFSGSLSVFGAAFPMGLSWTFEAPCGEVYPAIAYTVTGGESLIVCEK